MAEKTNLLNRILNSVIFRNARSRAGHTAKNPAVLLQLLAQVFQKLNTSPNGIVRQVQEKVGLLGRLLRSYARGDYREIPWKSLVLTVAVLIYFVSPLDVIPDLLPIIGLTDDVALILWLFRAISDDLEHFREWEKKQVVPLEAED